MTRIVTTDSLPTARRGARDVLPLGPLLGRALASSVSVPGRTPSAGGG